MDNELDLNVTDQTKINRLLNTIVASQQPVTLEFTNSDRTAKCLVLAIDSNSGRMKLGSVSSLETCSRITENSLFNLTTNVNGVHVRIRQLKAESVTTQDGTDVFSVKIPPTVFCSQRRSVFRAKVNGFIDVPVTVHAANTFPSSDVEPLARGTILDISVEGCAISVPEPNPTPIVDYKLLTVLQLSLPDHFYFPVLFAQLHYILPINEENLSTLGFSFTGNNKDTTRELGLLATRIQLLARNTTKLRA